MKLVKLTQPDDEPVWILPTWVQRVKGQMGDGPPDAVTEIQLSGARQFVKETPEIVAIMIDRAML